MKLLLDQGLPRTTALLLRNEGWDVHHVAEAGLCRAKDAEIMAVAKEQARTVVTLDADFHALLVLQGALMPSVVRIRIEGLKAYPLVELLKRILPEIITDIEKGAMITITEKSVRIRMLSKDTLL